MKKLLLFLITLITFTFVTMPISKNIQAIENNSLNAQSDEGQTVSPTFQVRVRVKKNGVKIRNNPLPSAKVEKTANAGETFKYTGHYLGYYIIELSENHSAFISDNENDTETYTIE